MAISCARVDGKIQMTIGLSHKVKDFDKLQIHLTSDGSPVQHTVSPAVNSFQAQFREITEVWQIEFADSHRSVELSIAQPGTSGRNLSQVETAQTIDGLRIFRNFSRRFKVDATVTMEEGESDKLDVSILDSEISRLEELNSFESGLQLAL